MGPIGADGEHQFGIAVHHEGNPLALRSVSLSADRSALRAVITELSTQETPNRFVLSLGRDYWLEPNLFEGIRTNCRDHATLSAGDLLLQEAKQLLVVAAASKTPALVVDPLVGEVTELSVQSVAVFTHWRIFICGADGQRVCVVDTKSRRQASAQ